MFSTCSNYCCNVYSYHFHSSFFIVRISRRSDGLPELWSLVECKYVGTFQPLTGSICQPCLVNLCISQFYSGRQRGGFQILFSFQYVASTPAPGMLAVELACMHLSLGSELWWCCKVMAIEFDSVSDAA